MASLVIGPWSWQSSHSHSADLGPPPMEYADLVVDRHNCHHQPQEMIRAAGHEGDRTTQLNDYMFHQQGQNHLTQPPMVVAPSSQLPQMDAMLSFADVMQFADFGPRLGLTPQSSGGVGAAAAEGMEGCFLRFPVLPGDDVDSPPEDQEHAAVSAPTMQLASSRDGFCQNRGTVSADGGMRNGEGEGSEPLFSVQEHQQPAYKGQVAAETKSSTNNNTNGNGSGGGGSNRRKRPRALKTSEEVESQRMTHIAVERNRRKQMNEHLRVLRSLMPGSYVQRGDQASIIGGAIEFVRELEQLLQCLESQKRRRLLGEGAPLLPPAAPVPQQLPPPQPTTAAFLSLPPPPAHDLLPLGSAADDPMKQLLDLDGGSDCREETAANATETAETKTVAADVEVKVAGLDAVIKVLSRRRTGQLLKTIAALEEMRFDVMHTNVTTIDQTVLYSFHVKTTAGMTRFSAEEIASSVQHMFGLFDSNAL